MRSSLNSIIRSTTPVTSILSHSSSSPVTNDHQTTSATLPSAPVDISTATPTVALARGVNGLTVEQLTSTPSAAAAAAAVAIAAFGQSAAAAAVVAGTGGGSGGGAGPGGGNCVPPSLSPPMQSTRTLNSTNSSSSSSNNNNNLLSSAHNPNELWSVARFSLDRPDYRIPFYRHDIAKHFQTFRHGEQTTQANGIG